MKKIRLGISTCPNDTFTFHALLTGEVKIPGVELEITLSDVEELNRGLFERRFDVAKASAHAALVASEQVGALDVGWALGHGVGPVVLASKSIESVDENTRVLAPGHWTTAHLLWLLFHPQPGQVSHCVFSEIMPALSAGQSELGVCIHEGRFTWESAGLKLFEDLGASWAAATDSPLPLGGIVAQRDLDVGLRRSVAAGIRESLAWGHAQRAATLSSMRQYAQEESDAVLWAHVDLYVNRWTQALGAEGERALATLSKLAREAGLISAGSALEVLI